MKKINLIFATFFLLLLVGCNTIPPADFTLETTPNVDKKDAELVSITVGYKAATRKEKRKIETNALVPPVWKESLQDAINRSLIFSDESKKKISISVQIYEFDLPFAGAAMTTSCGAKYEIMDRSNGEILFDESIETTGTVPFDYAFAGVVRATESINRCGRNNIYNLIERLNKINI